jgi:hypothetical protein
MAEYLFSISKVNESMSADEGPDGGSVCARGAVWSLRWSVDGFKA